MHTCRVLFVALSVLFCTSDSPASEFEENWQIRGVEPHSELTSPFIPELGDRLVFQYGDRQVSSESALLSLTVLRKSDGFRLGTGRIEIPLTPLREMRDAGELENWIRMVVEPQVAAILSSIPRDAFAINGATQERGLLSKILNWVVPSAGAVDWDWLLYWDWPGPLEFLRMVTIIPAAVAALYALGWGGHSFAVLAKQLRGQEVSSDLKGRATGLRDLAWQLGLGTASYYTIIVMVIAAYESEYGPPPKPHRVCERKLDKLSDTKEELEDRIRELERRLEN